MVCALISQLTVLCDKLYHPIALLVRLYLAKIFVQAGLLKLSNWQATLQLFQYEYKVSWLPLPPHVADMLGITPPPMPAEIAAMLGTAGELFVPALLVVGFGARLPAIALFVINYTAVVSYPYLWTEAGIAGFKDHLIWGALIGMLVSRGVGVWSVDQVLAYKCDQYKY